MKVGIMLSMIIWVVIAAWLQGCAALVGIKEWPTEHGPIKFVTGFDIGATATALDSKDDRQGVNAKELR